MTNIIKVHSIFCQQIKLITVKCSFRQYEDTHFAMVGFAPLLSSVSLSLKSLKNGTFSRESFIVLKRKYLNKSQLLTIYTLLLGFSDFPTDIQHDENMQVTLIFASPPPPPAGQQWCTLLVQSKVLLALIGYNISNWFPLHTVSKKTTGSANEL